MSRVTKIARLRHPGVLRDFTWPSDLPDFGRYNLIYGCNGSGKTTISGVFRALEAKSAPANCEVTLTIDGVDLKGQDFGQATLPVHVFNRDFVSESIFPSGGGDVPPIFVVGKEGVGKQKEVEGLKSRLQKAQDELGAARSRQTDDVKNLEKHCFDRGTVIRDGLRSAGQNRYNNFDKTAYRRRAQEMVDAGDGDCHRLGDSDRDSLLARHRAAPKPKITELAYELPSLEAFAEDVSDVLGTTVVAATIQSLRDDSSLASWVYQGLDIHQSRQSGTCLFCGQVIPEGRISAIEAHFGAEYELLLKRIDSDIVMIQAAARRADTLTLRSPAEFYDDLVADYEAAKQALEVAARTTSEAAGALVGALADKRGHPFDACVLDKAPPKVERTVVDRLNSVIQRHNNASDAFEARVGEARTKLEADFVAAELKVFLDLLGQVTDSQNQVRQAELEAQGLSAQILQLEREIVQHRRSAEELNDDLRDYLGHDELRLEVQATGYSITRNGEVAASLSEGEKTAIALLYFLKSLEDHRFEVEKAVVVLDDPVSSLDANALYLAFGFIRERTEDAGQVIILTHNFSFFRQVRNWFHHMKGQGKKDVSLRPARFYMLDRVRSDARRCYELRVLDPLLERYESEYHFLFASVYRNADAASSAGLADNYPLPNMARRLLEAFLAFRQPGVSGELAQKLRDLDFDEAKKFRILRFMHTYSHGDAIGESEHDPSLLGESSSVLKDLLELMKNQDASHFEAMEKLVKTDGDSQAADED